MCLVLDPGTIPPVFSSSHEHHEQFKPVLEWLRKGQGRIVYGGTKYIEELKKLTTYSPKLAELARAGKIVRVDDAAVDAKVRKLKSGKSPKQFDDPHIVAIVDVSSCKIVCTCDERSHKYIRDKSKYDNASLPKIYSVRTKKPETILVDKNIASICRNC